MGSTLLYILFFLSGISGLVYQVVWVREFGHVFGNTVHSASLVIAIFMLGLGVGSYAMGQWADRRYAVRPDSLLRAYAYVEGLIAALALGVSLVLPQLGALVAGMSAYTTGADGWSDLTLVSYIARAGLAILLVAPMTLLMGGTLTVLIRYLVRSDLTVSGWTIALLYGVNTAGAAAGAFLTDFAFVPVAGLFAAQMVAVSLNVCAAAGALWLAGPKTSKHEKTRKRPAVAPARSPLPAGAVAWTTLALALSGFGALGVEILWLRHASILLGGFRAVFSLLLTVLLVGLGLGALLGGWFERRHGRPAQALMMAQALFVVTVLFGLSAASVDAVGAGGADLRAMAPARRALTELWFNLKLLLPIVGLPAVLAGFTFPLANAIVQRAEPSVGRRAGMLYLANTAGAVCGSLVTGYVLLPQLGMQSSATVLASVSALAIVPIYLANRGTAAFVSAGLCAASALVVWLTLPGDHVVGRSLALAQAGDRVLAVSEGTNELIAVVETDGLGRGLLTNGHAMSSTALRDQRYMRALVHIPLLSMEDPNRVLVIGFGVGNSTHAATLHSSVRQVDVADLSRHILQHASYFREANQDTLQHPKVSVYVNDGRQHLQMVDEASYDLITLEPPPIAYAGVAALYSREFYELARSRLVPGGYVSQWLPAYQVPGESSLAMVRAFVDVFPQAVLLSGTQAELILLGTNGPRIEIDPVRLASTLSAEEAVRADLARLDLGTPREIVGSFVGSASTLLRATSASPAVTDDRPLQEYGVRSRLTTTLTGVPASLFELGTIDDWCPGCLAAGGDPAPVVAGLDLYMALMGQAYGASVGDVLAAATTGDGPARRIMGSTYLGSILPDSPAGHNILGVAALREGRVADAVREFEAALTRDPEHENARLNLGQVYYDEGALLLDKQRFEEAAARFRAAIRLLPDDAEAHNNLGVALASQGRVSEAAEQFERAVALSPDFLEARDNLLQVRSALAP